MSPQTLPELEQKLGAIEALLPAQGELTVDSPEALEAFRVELLGRKGKLTEILKSLKDLSIDERRVIGPRTQILRSKIEELVGQSRQKLESARSSAAGNAVSPRPPVEPA